MPPKVLRHTLALAGFDVPVIELTGSDGPRLTVPVSYTHLTLPTTERV